MKLDEGCFCQTTPIDTRENQKIDCGHVLQRSGDATIDNRLSETGSRNLFVRLPGQINIRTRRNLVAMANPEGTKKRAIRSHGQPFIQPPG
jgi:hypothetical protein